MASSSSLPSSIPMILTFIGQKNYAQLFNAATTHAFTCEAPLFFGEPLKDRANIQIGEDQVPNRDFLATRVWKVTEKASRKPVPGWTPPISHLDPPKQILPKEAMVEIPLLACVVAWFTNQIGMRENIRGKTDLYPLDKKKLCELDICELMGVDSGPVPDLDLPALTKEQQQLTLTRLVSIFHNNFFVERKPREEEVSQDVWIHAGHPVLYDVLKFNADEHAQNMEFYKSEKLSLVDGHAYVRVDFKFFVTKWIDFFIQRKMVGYFLNGDDFQ